MARARRDDALERTGAGVSTGESGELVGLDAETTGAPLGAGDATSSGDVTFGGAESMVRGASKSTCPAKSVVIERQYGHETSTLPEPMTRFAMAREHDEHAPRATHTIRGSVI